jgi:hypothetical protein
VKVGAAGWRLAIPGAPAYAVNSGFRRTSIGLLGGHLKIGIFFAYIWLSYVALELSVPTPTK